MHRPGLTGLIIYFSLGSGEVVLLDFALAFVPVEGCLALLIVADHSLHLFGLRLL
jgi:hypothetical protein